MSSSDNFKIVTVEELSLEDGEGGQFGYAILQLDPRSTEQGGGGWYLKGISIHNEFRGSGLGTRLLKAVIRQFGNEPIRLRVGPYDGSPLSWDETRDWYTRHGFTEVWEENNGNDIYMRRPANPAPQGFMRPKPIQDYTEGEREAALLTLAHRCHGIEQTLHDIRQMNRIMDLSICNDYERAMHTRPSHVQNRFLVKAMADRILELEALIASNPV